MLRVLGPHLGLQIDPRNGSGVLGPDLGRRDDPMCWVPVKRGGREVLCHSLMWVGSRVLGLLVDPRCWVPVKRGGREVFCHSLLRSTLGTTQGLLPSCLWHHGWCREYGLGAALLGLVFCLSSKVAKPYSSSLKWNKHFVTQACELLFFPLQGSSAGEQQIFYCVSNSAEDLDIVISRSSLDESPLQ